MKRVHMASVSTAIRANDPIGLLIGYMEEQLHGALTSLDRVARKCDEAAVAKSCGGLRRVVRVRAALHLALVESSGGVSLSRYLVSAQFLRKAYEAVTETANENLVYVTGPADGKDLFALERLVPFALAEASPVHAIPDPASQSEALMALTEAGEQLLATFHSHSWRGPDATNPSSKDLATQAQLERLGYPTVGGIFSRDGHVRFYSVTRAFIVRVSGNGIEHVGGDAHLFHLKGEEPEPTIRRRVVR